VLLDAFLAEGIDLATPDLRADALMKIRRTFAVP
jgi:hypothetical protein